MTKLTFWGLNEKFSAIAKRFPVPAIFAALTTFILIWLVDQENDHLFRWPVTGFLGFLAVLNWDLFTTTRKMTGWRYIAGVLAIIAGLGLFYSQAPANLSDETSCFWYLTAGSCIILHLSASVVPFTKQSPVNTIVSFNIRVFIAWMQSLLYSTILLSALSLALLAMTMLFGWEPAANAYIKLFILVTGLFQTGYFLAEIPSAEDHGFIPSESSVFKFLVSYAAVPITILYGVIVHVYIFKILIFQQSLVEWYQTMALWYIGFGGLAWLLGLLYENHHDNALLATLRKWFLPFTIAPMAALIWSLYKQSTVSGSQEQWYISLYFTTLCLGFLVLAALKRSACVRTIPIWFIIVTSAAFFSGKYSLCRYPVMAEQHQLTRTLEKQQLLRDNTLYRPATSLPDTNGFIAAGIEYLGRKNALDYIRQYDKNQLLDSLPDTLRAIDMITFLHIDTYNDFVDMHYWEYSRRNKDTIHIAGFDRLIPGAFFLGDGEKGVNAEYLLCTKEGKAVYIQGQDTLAKIDLVPMMKKVAKYPAKPYDTLVTLPAIDIRIVPQSATGRLEGNDLTMTSFSAYVLVRKK